MTDNKTDDMPRPDPETPPLPEPASSGSGDSAPETGPDAAPDAAPPAPVPDPLPEEAPPASRHAFQPETPPQAAVPPQAPAPLAAPRRQTGALLLTGLCAAALGGAIAFWLDLRSPADLTALQDRVAAQDSAMAALSDRIDGIPAAPDLAPLQEDIAALRADLVTATEGLRPALDDLSVRMARLERAPAADGTLSADAMAAWQSDLDALRAGLAAQAERIDAVAAQSTARIDATAEELANIEAQATEAARAAARRGAALQVLAALDSGVAFADPLAEAVGDGDRPPTLAALADTGVPTLATLAETFPEAARAALATARAEGLTGEEQGTVAAFLRSQFDVRSTTPQAGDGPDAILSRAEAALRAADPDAALAEIAALPEVVRGAMGDWLTQAQTRQTALAEAAALAETLNVN